MKWNASKKKSEMIEFDASELTPAQKRLVRSLNIVLKEILTTSDEGKFFDGSAEFMRMCASLIQQTKFSNELKEGSEIPYANQALEYSVEILHEHIAMSKVVTYDN